LNLAISLAKCQNRKNCKIRFEMDGFVGRIVSCFEVIPCSAEINELREELYVFSNWSDDLEAVCALKDLLWSLAISEEQVKLARRLTQGRVLLQQDVTVVAIVPSQKAFPSSRFTHSKNKLHLAVHSVPFKAQDHHEQTCSPLSAMLAKAGVVIENVLSAEECRQVIARGNVLGFESLEAEFPKVCCIQNL
jgi:hypothetical protein